MQVVKYKKKRDGKYTVSFSNGKELDLYEEVILKYELLLKKEFSDSMLYEFATYNQECDVYYVALKHIKSRLRSRKEIGDMLRRQEYPIDFIEKSLCKLEKQGYINDYNYASSYLHDKLITTSWGPNKIAYELEKQGISREIILEVMSEYTKELEFSKIEKIVNRSIKSNRNKSNVVLKRKIEQELLQQGFHKENIERIITNVSFPSDGDLYQKEYEKIYQKLSKKYSGDRLTYQVKQKMYQRGFRYED